MKKIESSKVWLCEQNKYILSATNKLKLDKGLTNADWAKAGIPQDSFRITLEELIVFYRVLETLQDSYEAIIIENSIMSWNIGSYFRNIEAIKPMLESGLSRHTCMSAQPVFKYYE